MRPSNDLPAVYLCRESVDFRKGINGLAALVEESLALDPFSEQLFVFGAWIIEGSQMLFRYKQEMNRGPGADVLKNKDLLILVNHCCRDLACCYFAENAI